MTIARSRPRVMVTADAARLYTEPPTIWRAIVSLSDVDISGVEALPDRRGHLVQVQVQCSDLSED